MPMANPFDTPAFNAASLTQAINLLPPMATKLDERNLMPARGVRTRTVIAEERNGVLNLLPTLPVGSPGTPNLRDKRTVRSFVIPHIPHDDTIFPEDVQGLRAFGMENELEPLATLVNDVQQQMRNKQDVTLEHLRVGALKGIILDADGSTLYNLFTEFGITGVTSYTSPKANFKKRLQIDFVLGTAGTDVLGKCNAVARHIEANLGGEAYSGIDVYCDATFFDKLVSHATVKEAYARWQNGEALRSDMRGGFKLGRLNFIEYEGAVSDMDGNIRTYIPSDEGIAFPVGTGSTFATYFAPADFNEAANTMGQRLYSKIEARKFGRGWDLHTQSNPLPICHRPSVLVRLHSSN